MKLQSLGAGQEVVALPGRISAAPGRLSTGLKLAFSFMLLELSEPRHQRKKGTPLKLISDSLSIRQ